MFRLLQSRAGLIALVFVVLAFSPVRTAAPVPVMLLDGSNNHDWRATSPVIADILQRTGKFELTTVSVANDALATFAPDWSKYAAVVMNYNTGIDSRAPEWPEATKAAFARYVKEGGGLVSVHAADNAFAHWPEFNEMIGVGGWGGRDPSSGPHWFVQDGKVVSDPLPPGSGGHGRRIPFDVVVRDATHPIMKGLPAKWTHAADELYNTLRGPGAHMTILATAYSDPANSGTGRDEPVIMVIDYGRGRVFHTTLGHDVPAMQSPDFAILLQRGTEWAATGKVTQPVPADFK
jgi:uncharacterized protein